MSFNKSKNIISYIRVMFFILLILILLNLFYISFDKNNVYTGNEWYKNFQQSHNSIEGSVENCKRQKNILNWQGNYLISNEGKLLSSMNCPKTNCRFTEDSSDILNGDISMFDAVIFNENYLVAPHNKPLKRSPKQLYIFNTIESSYNHPACEVELDNFFNWTFTHRLDSDVVWNYFIVKDLTGSQIAPKTEVKWETSTKPIAVNIHKILLKKRKAAAWLVSHCKADSFRDDYLTELKVQLDAYSLKIDVYGECSKRRCLGDCELMIRNDYFFYMAFENSFSEDYVTEKVLHGYQNYAVPIVYGGANYSRFLPPGSYLNAREIHPYNLAHIMYQSMLKPELYQSFFSWTNLYTVEEETGSRHPLCQLCAALDTVTQSPANPNFRLWWNRSNGLKWCLSNEFWNETAKVNLDASHIFKVF